ncbi:class II fructose-bisphosphate aldolase [Aerococcus urinae]|uniref:class II fructose-bisphosphate aldolase n=1 Tax=Aerococcus TaxID=1375 RepID=UPI0018A759EA|nr:MULTISPECIES: class II fructose-bisphosphate aldolase [Aerococcus]MCY3036275.1 class II fructose-bisphosphate aldolase [Aerococcus sp. Group 2]MDK6520289.1 class II fructose-bisphosphate aldolase [Aerococcus urinae]
MKVDSKELLLDAKQKGYAIPAPNFIDLDSARAYVEVAEKRGLPVILSYAQKHVDIISLEEAALIGNFLADRASVPVVLHLDHGFDKDFIFKAIDLGFSAAMIDASEASFEDNVKITKEVVDYAHKYNVPVEAELGHVGANDLSEARALTDSVYTETKDVVRFVEATGVDSLAVSIGTAHGVYSGTPEINFDRLEEINQATDIPLVLHGGSSSGDENLKKCAQKGVAKINVYTDFIVAAYEAIQKEQPAGYVEVKKTADQAMKAVLDHYYDVFETNRYKEGK